MGESEYSFSLTTFSPSGKLVQIEYALNAVSSGSTSLGIKGASFLVVQLQESMITMIFSATNGVVIAAEKKSPSILVDGSSLQKVSVLTDNIGVVYSGMGPDVRVLIRKARKKVSIITLRSPVENNSFLSSRDPG